MLGLLVGGTRYEIKGLEGIMLKGLRRLKEGDFNSMGQEWLPDGSVIVVLTSRKWEGVEHFRVRNLYQEGEELLDVDTGEPIP